MPTFAKKKDPKKQAAGKAGGVARANGKKRAASRSPSPVRAPCATVVLPHLRPSPRHPTLPSNYRPRALRATSCWANRPPESVCPGTGEWSALRHSSCAAKQESLGTDIEELDHDFVVALLDSLVENEGAWC